MGLGEVKSVAHFGLKNFPPLFLGLLRRFSFFLGVKGGNFKKNYWVLGIIQSGIF